MHSPIKGGKIIRSNIKSGQTSNYPGWKSSRTKENNTQKNEDGNSTKLPTDAYTLKIKKTVWTLDEEEIRKPYDLKDPL